MSSRLSVVAVSVALLFGAQSCSKEAAASGEKGTRLALSKPANQTITQGESNGIGIAVDRTGFAGPVQIEFSNLPRGITVNGDTIPAGESRKDFMLVAAPDAEVTGRRIVTVKAVAADIHLSQTFELSVEARN